MRALVSSVVCCPVVTLLSSLVVGASAAFRTAASQTFATTPPAQNTANTNKHHRAQSFTTPLRRLSQLLLRHHLSMIAPETTTAALLEKGEENHQHHRLDEEIVVEHDTLQWVRRVVVGLNLCPFARPAMLQGNDAFRVSVVLQEDISTDVNGVVLLLLRRLQEEMQRLVDRGSGTTLVVCPNCHPDSFVDFMDVVRLVEDTLLLMHTADEDDDDDDSEQCFGGMLQIAPFHPQFRFEGSGPDDPDNYTNRSPYPMFHLLLEEEVSHAVDQLPEGDASMVWSRNVDLLQSLHQELTHDDFQSIFATKTSRQQQQPRRLSARVRSKLRDLLLGQFRIRPLSGRRTNNKPH